MIYLHCCSLESILGNKNSLRLTSSERQKIRDYVYEHLSSFCRVVDLPQPHIVKHQYGKPYCENIPLLVFNYSHSQGYFILAYSLDEQDIGIDMEDLSRQVKMEGLAKHSFHQQELEAWYKNNCSREFWFKIWTTKEAVLKAHGLGIRINLNEINTQVKLDNTQGIMQHSLLGDFIYHHIQTENCMITLAYRQQQSSMLVGDKFDESAVNDVEQCVYKFV